MSDYEIKYPVRVVGGGIVGSIEDAKGKNVLQVAVPEIDATPLARNDVRRKRTDLIADALNDTAPGTFAWALKWMGENVMGELTCGASGDILYRCNHDGVFEYCNKNNPDILNRWVPLVLTMFQTDATDWRIA